MDLEERGTRGITPEEEHFLRVTEATEKNYTVRFAAVLLYPIIFGGIFVAIWPTSSGNGTCGAGALAMLGEAMFLLGLIAIYLIVRFWMKRRLDGSSHRRPLFH